MIGMVGAAAVAVCRIWMIVTRFAGEVVPVMAGGIATVNESARGIEIVIENG